MNVKQSQYFKQYFHHLVVLLLLALISNPALAEESGYIVFVSSDDHQLYSVIDGEVRQQTFNPFSLNSDPAWSPNGKYITYSAHPVRGRLVDHERQIFIKPINDEEIVQLTFDGGNSEPAWSPDGKRIAFTRTIEDRLNVVNSRSDIFVMDAEGKSIVQLTKGGDGTSSSPDWSPDGREIVYLFASDPRSIPRIYIMNADGTSPHPLFMNRASVDEPKWSPTGRYIAYWGGVEISPEARYPQLYIMNTVTQKLTRITEAALIHETPAWSPDGTEIAFAAGVEDKQDIYIIRVEDGKITQLTHDLTREVQPTWSPDGEHVAFVSFGRGKGDIYRMTRKGENRVQLTNHPESDLYPAWSPNGNQIAFFRSKDIYLMDIDGGNQVNLTQDGKSFLPAWSPDGRQIAYFWEDGNRSAIHIMNSDGRNRVEVRAAPNLRVSNISWSPDGKKLAYTCRQDQGIRRGPQVCIFDFETETEEIPLFEPAFPEVVQWAPSFGRRYVVAARPPLSSIDRLYGIFIIDRNGMNNRLLFSRKNLNKTQGGLSWSPDEQAIMFADENEKLFILDVNTGHRQLFMEEGYKPDWIDPFQSVSPKGKQVTSWGAIKRKIVDR